VQEHGLAADGAVEPAPAVCAAAPLGLVGAAAWGRIIFAHAHAQVEGEAGEVEGLRQARAARVDVVVEAGEGVEEPATNILFFSLFFKFFTNRSLEERI